MLMISRQAEIALEYSEFILTKYEFIFQRAINTICPIKKFLELFLINAKYFVIKTGSQTEGRTRSCVVCLLPAESGQSTRQRLQLHTENPRAFCV